MTDNEREELIEKMARAAWESDGFESWEEVRKNGKNSIYAKPAPHSMSLSR